MAVAALIGIGCLLLLGALAWHREPFCPHCVHCEAERRKRDIEQQALQHDTEHKGFWWHPGDPDRFKCHDDKCPRNKT